MHTDKTYICPLKNVSGITVVKVLVKSLKVTSPVMVLVLRFKICNERSSDSCNHM